MNTFTMEEQTFIVTKLSAELKVACSDFFTGRTDSRPDVTAVATLIAKTFIIANVDLNRAWPDPEEVNEIVTIILLMCLEYTGFYLTHFSVS